ncbi:hypothetical protein PR048_020090 [Dryococelus australis]|uniref:Uncharacterized protein n=1 Tax=Dryococelus australis TaxID=614101 RepID=A0ABQ9H5A7_9NEOP|nr:hypothetical protein PR048_020090 [Dryococelus australis]
MLLVSGFSQGSPVPPFFHFGASPYSPHFTLICSQVWWEKLESLSDCMALQLIIRKEEELAGRRECLPTDAMEGIVCAKRLKGRRRYKLIYDIKGRGKYMDLKRLTEDRRAWRDTTLKGTKVSNRPVINASSQDRSTDCACPSRLAAPTMAQFAVYCLIALSPDAVWWTSESVGATTRPCNDAYSSRQHGSPTGTPDSNRRLAAVSPDLSSIEHLRGTSFTNKADRSDPGRKKRNKTEAKLLHALGSCDGKMASLSYANDDTETNLPDGSRADMTPYIARRDQRDIRPAPRETANCGGRLTCADGEAIVVRRWRRDTCRLADVQRQHAVEAELPELAEPRVPAGTRTNLSIDNV